MPIYDQTDYNVNPYYDDYATNGTEYLRVLFRPGYAIQARELTQIQTALQNQVGRFASHIFENGSRVYGGGGTDQKTDFLRTDKTFDSTDAVSGGYTTGTVDVANLQDQIIYSVSGDAKAKVVHYLTGTDNDPFNILFIQYLDGTNTFAHSEHFYATGVDGLRVDAQTKINTGTYENWEVTGGDAHVISTDDSIYYVDGMFVNALPQSTALVKESGTGERLFTSPTSSIGFNIKKEFVTAKDDSTLNDPARGTSNYAAPGSDRLKITLGLDSLNYDASAGSTGVSKSDYFEIMRIENGNLIKDYRYPIYSALADEMARRTYDESGNYTVRPFGITIREHLNTGGNNGVYTAALDGDADKLAIAMEAGKAYIFGYEFENLATNFIGIDKARDTSHQTTFTAESLSLPVGNYAKITGGTGTSKWNAWPGDPTNNRFIESGQTLKMFGPVYRYVLDGTAAAASNFTVGEVVTYATGAIGASSNLTGTIIAWEPNTAGAGSRVTVFASNDDVFVSGGYLTGNTSSVTYHLTGTFASGLSGGDLDGVGTTRVRNIDRYDDDEDNLHLFDLQMHLLEDQTATGADSSRIPFAAVREFATGSGGPIIFNIHPNGKSNGLTTLFEPENTKSLYEVPFGNTVKSIANLTYSVQQEFKETPSSGAFSSTAPANGKFRASTDNGDGTFSPSASEKREHYKLYNTVTKEVVDLDGSGTVVVMKTNTAKTELNVTSPSTNLPANLHILISTVDINAAPAAGTNIRTKSIQTAEVFVTGSSGVLTLPHADVIEVTSVTGGDNGEQIVDKFNFDNGQTDSYYGYGTLNLKDNAVYTTAGTAIPENVTGTATVKYFSHSGENGPFIYSSYPSYDTIPEYTSKTNGKVYKLVDCIDFRSSLQNGGIVNTSATSWFPKAGENAFITYTHYLSRIDKVVLTKDKEFQTLSGVPALNPVAPPDRDDSMTLYVVKVPAYTYGPTGCDTRYVENKRYTMRDIGKIDKRVDRLEYFTTLSLLERETTELSIKDANGVEKFKNGILVDPFKGHSIGDVSNPDYKCSIDFENEELRPSFETRNIKLDAFLTGTSTNATGTPDGLYLLDYSTTSAIEQPMASESLSVNPFNVISWLGDMRMNPDSDNWFDTSKKPIVQVNSEGENDAWEQKASPFGTQWNDWELIWTGKETSATEDSLAWATSTGKYSREALASGKVKARKGITTRAIPESITKSIGNRTINISVVPYIRSNDIECNSFGMKPETTIYIFFDGTDVTSRTTPLSFNVTSTSGAWTSSNIVGQKIVGDSSGASATVVSATDANPAGLVSEVVVKDVTNGPFSSSENVTCNSKTGTIGGFTYKTDANGKFAFSLAIEGSKFQVGDRQVRVTDSPTNDLTTATTAADAVYSAEGYIFTQGTSTRKPTLRRPNVNSETIITNPIDRQNQANGTNDTVWRDPLAQSFLVDPIFNPNGMFIDSVDLWFSAKDGSLPVSVEIRPTVNGYPSSGVVLPMASKTITPSDVTTTTTPKASDTSTSTNFKFSSPIYLLPGEYALVVLSNSGEYKAYTATIGANRVDGDKSSDNDPISNQPYAGVLFKSQNSSTWTADQTKDLMFRLNRCEFPTATNATVEFVNHPYAASTYTQKFANVDVFRLVSDHIEFGPNVVTFGVDLSTDGSGVGAYDNAISINPNTNIELNSTRRINEEYTLSNDPTNSPVRLQSVFNTSDSKISPVIDSSRFDLIAVENLIHNNTVLDPNDADDYNGELEPRSNEGLASKLPEGTPGVTGDSPSGVCRYVTRRVQLEPGFESKDMKVYLNATRPGGTTIHAFMKTATPEFEGDFDGLRYKQLNEVGAVEFGDSPQEIIFQPVTGDIQEPFDRFTIKLVLYSGNSAVVPKVQDLRAIALPEG